MFVLHRVKRYFPHLVVLRTYLSFGTIRRMAKIRNHTPQDATLSIRLYKPELEAIKKYAEKLGKSLAEATREVMLKWAKYKP